MSKISVVDTNILIAFYNRGLFEEELVTLNQKSRLFYSVVTLNEFIRGAHDPTSKQIVSNFMEITGEQIFAPTKKQWIECGYVSETLLKNKKKSKEGVLLLQNDILIALGARDIGGTIVTSDQKDFQLIQSVVQVNIDFW